MGIYISHIVCVIQNVWDKVEVISIVSSVYWNM